MISAEYQKMLRLDGWRNLGVLYLGSLPCAQGTSKAAGRYATLIAVGYDNAFDETLRFGCFMYR